METKYLTTKQLAVLIGLTPYNIRRLTRLGKLPAYKLDKKNYLYNYSEIENIIKSNKI